jgi:hypothetical protein
MQLNPLSAIDLFKIREVLEESTVFLKESNLPNPDDFTDQIFLEEIPGTPKFYSIDVDSNLVGFIKVSEQFPLPGFLHIRLLVIKERFCGLGYGSKVITNLKKISKGSLWINGEAIESSLPFWVKKGFKEEVSRWVLS